MKKKNIDTPNLDKLSSITILK